MSSQVHCARCGAWHPLDEVRLLGAPSGMFLWSPLCRECENPRRPSRFERVGVPDEMPSPELARLLYDTCRDVLQEHQDLAAEFWARKDGALKKLVTKAMNKSHGRLDPADVQHELTIRLEAWPQIRLIEDEMWGVYDWGSETWISTHGSAFEAEMAWEQALAVRGFEAVSPIAVPPARVTN